MRAPHPALFTERAPYRIDRLSPRASASVYRAERYADAEGVWPGATETALFWYRQFLAGPGRYLEIGHAVCPCPSDSLEDVAEARDVLEHVALLLPVPARREFRAFLSRLDAELWRRTLPDPFAFRDPRRRGGWWHQRLRGDRPFG
ncbi:hypothetical protein ACODT3_38685 [Streptomyces sp. 4.24]|uniref:hypothetical protein n=1 Tax=Streptomyces tritrimontium TaxID=3406573 RepID=UPI003BB5F95F